MADGCKWYVLKTVDGYENRAVTLCKEYRDRDILSSLIQIVDFKIPKDEQEEPIIPGYIFIFAYLDPQLYYELPRVPYISYWVGTKIRFITKDILKRASPLGVNYPQPLSDEDLQRLENITEICKDFETNRAIIEQNLIPGSVYPITKGSLTGAKCIFQRLVSSDLTKAEVDVIIFKRPVAMTISVDHIGKRIGYWEG